MHRSWGIGALHRARPKGTPRTRRDERPSAPRGAEPSGQPVGDHGPRMRADDARTPGLAHLPRETRVGQQGRHRVGDGVHTSPVDAQPCFAVDQGLRGAAGVADDDRTATRGRLDEDIAPALDLETRRRVRQGIAKTSPTA